MLSRWGAILRSLQVTELLFVRTASKKSSKHECDTHCGHDFPLTDTYDAGNINSRLSIIRWFFLSRQLLEDGYLFPKDQAGASQGALNPSRYSLEKQVEGLLRLLKNSYSPKEQVRTFRRICGLLTNHPETQTVFIHNKAVSQFLRAREFTRSATVRRQALKALALLGYADPPKGNGIRILSMDGGGTRNIAIYEQLKHLEHITGKRISETFDMVCGVSAGAILATLVCGLKVPLEGNDSLFEKVLRVFKRDFWGGTYRLITQYAYYDSHQWDALLKEVYAETSLIDSAKDSEIPKFVALSAVVTTLGFRPYAFRNYNPPERALCNYEGGCHHKVREALRASSSAPGYFEEFVLEGQVHQDGGIVMNNPSALGIHEAQQLWPDERIQCVISLGSGRYSPAAYSDQKIKLGSTSLKGQFYNLIVRATDTQVVHQILHDLMQNKTYYRFDPPLSEYVELDENRTEKLEQVKTDTQMFIRKNKYKFKIAVGSLKIRSTIRSLVDKCKLIYLLLK